MPTARALLVSLSLLFAAPAWAGGIAHVDVESIVKDMPAYKRAQTEVQTYGKQLQSRLTAEEKKVMAYYQEVMEQAQSGLMAPAAQQEAQQKLAQMQQDLQQAASDADAALLRKEQELTAPLYRSFNAAVKAVAQEKDYDYIIDEKTALVARGPDASAAVRAKLGL